MSEIKYESYDCLLDTCYEDDGWAVDPDTGWKYKHITMRKNGDRYYTTNDTLSKFPMLKRLRDEYEKNEFELEEEYDNDKRWYYD